MELSQTEEFVDGPIVRRATRVPREKNAKAREELVNVFMSVADNQHVGVCLREHACANQVSEVREERPCFLLVVALQIQDALVNVGWETSFGTHPVKYTTYALDTLVLPETTFVLLGALTLVKSVHPEHVRVRVLVGVPSGVCENPIQLEPAWA